jgi:hypothetical protein
MKRTYSSNTFELGGDGCSDDNDIYYSSTYVKWGETAETKGFKKLGWGFKLFGGSESKAGDPIPTPVGNSMTS